MKSKKEREMGEVSMDGERKKAAGGGGAGGGEESGKSDAGGICNGVD
jgi:hypothetical protein